MDPKTESNALLELIFERSSALGWSDQRFSKESGVPTATIWRVAIRGTSNPRLDTVVALARAVGLRVELVPDRRPRAGRNERQRQRR